MVTGSGYEVPLLLLKFAPDGNIQWQKTFSNHFQFLSTDDSGFILAGEIPNGADMVKVDDSGNIVWSRTLRIDAFSLKALGHDPDDGVILAGKSQDSNILSLIRLNSNGQIRSKARYSLEASFSLSDIVPARDGGYVVTGNTEGNAFVLRIDAQNRLSFQRTIGVRGSKESVLSIFPTSEGGYFLIGRSGINNQLILRLNSEGLVPGCTYFQDLNSKAVPAGSYQVGSSNVSSQSATLQERRFLDVTSKSSRHSISNVCE